MEHSSRSYIKLLVKLIANFHYYDTTSWVCWADLTSCFNHYACKMLWLKQPFVMLIFLVAGNILRMLWDGLSLHFAVSSISGTTVGRKDGLYLLMAECQDSASAYEMLLVSFLCYVLEPWKKEPTPWCGIENRYPRMMVSQRDTGLWLGFSISDLYPCEWTEKSSGRRSLTHWLISQMALKACTRPGQRQGSEAQF